MKLNILNLYPRQMNIYGDTGNLLVLQRRAQWRGIDVRVTDFNPGDLLPAPQQVDIIVGGGGQDSGQAVIQQDLQRIAADLHAMVEAGTPTLVVCGTYQLFGNYFKTFEGTVIEGIGIFNAHTIGGDRRMIGNIVTRNSDFGELIGYENHSGKTYLGAGLEPLAMVISGDGNNGTDKTEGARYKNALGTYLHGPLLPKNPQIADFLLKTALTNTYGTEATSFFAEKPEGLALDDSLVEPARKAAKERPR
jgi:CobQ-like glutamine amidotransferase family enzyme